MAKRCRFCSNLQRNPLCDFDIEMNVFCVVFVLCVVCQEASMDRRLSRQEALESGGLYDQEAISRQEVLSVMSLWTRGPLN